MKKLFWIGFGISLVLGIVIVSCLTTIAASSAAAAPWIAGVSTTLLVLSICAIEFLFAQTAASHDVIKQILDINDKIVDAHNFVISSRKSVSTTDINANLQKAEDAIKDAKTKNDNVSFGLFISSFVKVLLDRLKISKRITDEEKLITDEKPENKLKLYFAEIRTLITTATDENNRYKRCQDKTSDRAKEKSKSAKEAFNKARKLLDAAAEILKLIPQNEKDTANDTLDDLEDLYSSLDTDLKQSGIIT